RLRAVVAARAHAGRRIGRAPGRGLDGRGADLAARGRCVVTGATLVALAAARLAAAGIVELAAAPRRRHAAAAAAGEPDVRGRRRHGLVLALARLGRRAGAPAAPADLAWRMAAAGLS